jgi:CheY-like chemotaxis protein
MKKTVRILHIEDDPDTRLLMRELLREAAPPEDEVGIEWLEAGDVEEAVARWRGAALDALLVDNRLGGGEGIEEIGRLRSIWECPLWIVSGAPDARLRERAARKGAAGLLAKDDLLLDAGRLQAVLQQITAPGPACR